MVKVYGNLGATSTINGTVTVTAGTVFAKGLTFSCNRGGVNKAPVASFVDQSPLALGSYQTSIDWGDGVTSSGTVLKLSGSTSFKVIGSHQYTDSGTYPVNVTIAKNAEVATAWSTALASRINKPAFLPPFPIARLSPSFSFSDMTLNSGSSKYVALKGTMTIQNMGNKTSTPSSMSFYLADLINGQFSNVTQFYYLGKTTLALPAIKPGAKLKIPFTFSADSHGHITKSTLLILPVDIVAYPNAYSSTSVVAYIISGSDPILDAQSGETTDTHFPSALRQIQLIP